MSRRLTAVPAHRRRAVLYVRVSAIMGREDLHSPDLQLTAMREFAKRQALTEAYVVQDIDVSGRTFSRTGITELRRLAAEGLVDVVTVYNLSRLGRNTAETLRFITELRDLGVAIASTVENIDDSPEGQFMLTQFCSMAQLYSDQLSRSWADTATHIARSGHFHGQVPLGYRRTPPRAVEIDEGKAAVVRRIFTLYDSGWSLAQITRDIAPLLGARTRPTTVKEILANPAYVGKVRLRGEVYPGQHPPLVDERLWERVQQRLERPRLPSRTVQASHALAGLVRCGQDECELVLVRKPGRSRDGVRRVALVCQSQEIGACPGIGAPNEEQLHAAVLDAVESLASRLVVDEAARLERKRAKTQVRSAEKALRVEIGRVKRSIDTLTLKLAEDKISDHTYESTVQTLEQKRTRLLGELAATQESILAPPTVTLAQAERLRQAWPDLTSQERNRALRLWIRAVIVMPPVRRGQPVGERLRVTWL